MSRFTKIQASQDIKNNIPYVRFSTGIMTTVSSKYLLTI